MTTNPAVPAITSVRDKPNRISAAARSTASTAVPIRAYPSRLVAGQRPARCPCQRTGTNRAAEVNGAATMPARRKVASMNFVDTREPSGSTLLWRSCRYEERCQQFRGGVVGQPDRGGKLRVRYLVVLAA